MPNFSVKITSLDKDLASDTKLIDDLRNIYLAKDAVGNLVQRSITETKVKELLRKWQMENTSEYDTGEI